MPFSSKQALDMLDSAKRNNRLGHAYFISSPFDEVLKSFGLDTLKWLFPRELKKANHLSDVFHQWVKILSPQSKSQIISVEEIRSLEKFLYLACPKNLLKVAIISPADRMTNQAANAFLKTLEEAPNQTFILLLSTLPQEVLPTILSRCVQMNLLNLDISYQTGFLENFWKKLEKLLAEGNFTLADALSLKESFLACINQKKEKLSLAFDEEKSQSDLDSQWLAQKKEKEDSLLNSAYLNMKEKALEEIACWFVDALRVQEGFSCFDLPQYQESSQAISEYFSSEELFYRLKVIDNLKQQWKTNVQEEFALEVAFLELFSKNDTFV